MTKRLRSGLLSTAAAPGVLEAIVPAPAPAVKLVPQTYALAEAWVEHEGATDDDEWRQLDTSDGSRLYVRGDPAKDHEAMDAFLRVNGAYTRRLAESMMETKRREK